MYLFINLGKLIIISDTFFSFVCTHIIHHFRNNMILNNHWMLHFCCFLFSIYIRYMLLVNNEENTHATGNQTYKIYNDQRYRHFYSLSIFDISCARILTHIIINHFLDLLYITSSSLMLKLFYLLKCFINIVYFNKQMHLLMHIIFSLHMSNMTPRETVHTPWYLLRKLINEFYDVYFNFATTYNVTMFAKLIAS